MSNNKQSSVEWLAEEFANHIEEIYGMKITNLNLLVKAKAMHKDEIENAYDSGLFDGSMDSVNDRLYNKYYKETFNT